MQSLPKESWRYAFLLVLLFAIATVATHATIGYIEPLVAPGEHRVLTAILCTLIAGLMLISASFAVWAIRFSAESESQRRLGQLVSTMTYIKDGVLILDRHGNVTELNPAAREMLSIADMRETPLKELFPHLADADRQRLVSTGQPEEVECAAGATKQGHMFRLRSQPSKGVTLLLVSDVTRLTDDRSRRRRAAYLQLMGHIAQGVANDFNNLLCGIAGHASLIARSPDDNTVVATSSDAIVDCANRGIQLAGSLLELSTQPQSSPLATGKPSVCVDAGIDGLIANLPPSWNVYRTVADDVPAVNMPAAQIEHIVHSLGLLVSDTYSTTSKLAIHLVRPQPSGIAHADADFAGFIIFAPLSSDELIHTHVDLQDVTTNGLIDSVVASMLEQAGGRLDYLRDLNGACIYRACLPHATTDDVDTRTEGLPLGLEAYISGWHVLISKDLSDIEKLQRFMTEAGVLVDTADGIVGVLSEVDKDSDLAAIVIDGTTLGDQNEPGLLRAIVKLCPQAGLVVQQAETDADRIQKPDVVFVSPAATTGQIVRAMIEARSLARARQSHAKPA
jgi:PAS domain-containing protein